MFGGGSAPSSGGESEKDGPTTPSSSSSPHPGPANHDLNSPEVGRLSEESTGSGEKSHSVSESSPSRKSIDGANPSGEKKRRSGKASSLLASARNSLHLPGSTSSSHLSSSSADASDNSQTPLQKLGKQDPALAVPQGSHNNSAGESLPGARSTFRVGVTEDRNKKCRRTMEDTHSYLYNFLNTPAPALDLETGSKTGESTEELSPSSEQHYNHSAEPASNVVETDNGYFAIFDGHAGTFAADWCGKKLHGILEDAIRKNPNTPIPDLLDQTFTTVDRELEKLPLKNSGCTAVIAVLRWEDRIPNSHSATGSAAIAPVAAAVAKAATEAFAASNPSGHDEGSKPISEIAPSLDQSHLSSGASTADALPSNSSSVPARQTQLQQSASRQRVLYTANVGDARIVLCRNGKALRLSYDHKGSDENEGRRVSNAGGLILNNRVNGVLAVTRALGDTYMKELVTGHPYTTETVIQPDADEFIILACDGLWDVCTDQEAVDLIRSTQDPQAASKMLVDYALARFSTDNLSCMIVRLDGQAVQSTVEHRTEPIGVEGDPATRRGRLSEAEALVLGAKQKAWEGGARSIADDRKVVTPETVAKLTQGEPGPELHPEPSKDVLKR